MLGCASKLGLAKTGSSVIKEPMNKQLRLDHLIGLPDIKEQVRIQIAASKNGHTIFPHCILYGIGGSGKTSVVHAISNELDYYFVETEGATFKTRDDIYAKLRTSLKQSKDAKKPLLFFVDEVHRLNHTQQEAFYIPMKECRIEDEHIEPFCLFVATTRFDLLDAGSFVTRFQNIWQIDRYKERYIQQIIADELRKRKVEFKPDAVIALSKRCLGIPRIAVNLAKSACDYLIAKGHTELAAIHVEAMCLLNGIDCIGLNRMHRSYLKALNEMDKPIGLGVIASKLRQHKDMVEGSIEPILFELDFVAPTARGRQITMKGRQHWQKNICLDSR